MYKVEVIKIRGNVPGKGYLECLSLMTSDEYGALCQLSQNAKAARLRYIFKEETGEAVSGPAIFYDGTIVEIKRSRRKQLLQTAQRFLSTNSLTSDFLAPENS